MGEDRFSAEISEPALRTSQDAVLPHSPCLQLYGSAEAPQHGSAETAANTPQLLTELLCSVPAQVDTGLQERWLARIRYSLVP